jgi:hypothetical protein
MMVATLAALAGALMAIGPTGPAPTPLAARDVLDRGRTAFGRAEYQRAIEILHPLLYPEVQLDSENEVVEAHRMLGVAYLFENQPDEARREFGKLLELLPDYQFDPLLDPQRVVDFFNAVRKDKQGAIASIQAKRHQHEQEQIAKRQREALRLSLPPSIVRYERHSFAINFIPFGAGQFQNGQRRKGWFFLGTEAGLAAISLGAFVTNFTLYGAAPHRDCSMQQPQGVQCEPQAIDHTREDRSRALLGVQLVSGGLFWAVAIWGVIDAIRNHQPEVLLSDDGAASGARPASSSGRLMLSPGGLGAAWTF